MATQAEIARRRELIMDMMDSGVSEPDMQNHLAQAGFPSSVDTLKRDFRAIRKARLAARGGADKVRAHLANTLGRLDRLADKAFRQYVASNTTDTAQGRLHLATAKELNEQDRRDLSAEDPAVGDITVRLVR